ncbi:MAG: putative Ig domain-containing protein, partial [Proteobacteria bacterium]|nr:putative Ig domain-containing protein [Pseudomonadota bacterium]
MKSPAQFNLHVDNEFADVTRPSRTAKVLAVTAVMAMLSCSDSTPVATSSNSPALSNLAAQTLPTGQSFEPLVFVNRGGVVSGDTPCKISPQLPEGLNLTTFGENMITRTPGEDGTEVLMTTTRVISCQIAGIPIAPAGRATYTVTATNADGQGSATVSIAVVGDRLTAPSLANAADQTYTAATQIEPLIFANSGGSVSAAATPAGCTVDTSDDKPGLPSGLTLGTVMNQDVLTCQITGTPETAAAAVNVTIMASNAAGASPAATVSITVNAATTSTVPVIAAVGDVSALTYTAATAITAITFTNTGATITSCASDRSLPQGLIIDQTTCAISGTPADAAVSADYIITASSA